jgi:hypothetical protein
MNLRIFILQIFLLPVTNVLAQNKTYLGIELAATNDQLTIVDNGADLKSVPLVEGLWGFTIRQEFKHTFFVETGLIRKYYFEGFGFHGSDTYGTSSAFDAWIIPFRIGSRIDLYKRSIHLVPLIGYSLGINSDYGYDGFGRGRQYRGDLMIVYEYTSRSVSKNYFLMQAGLGLEFELFKILLLSISTNYYSGMKDVSRLDIAYTVGNSPTRTAKAVSSGDFLSFGTSIKFPVSYFWQHERK